MRTRKNNCPLVTVVVPAYNHERFVAQCLESIERQSYPSLELLIVNDGSSDSTDAQIRKWMSTQGRRWERIEYLSQANKGITHTLNRALVWCRGKYISPIASDDILCEDKISLLVESLEAKGDSHAVAFGNARFMDEEGGDLTLGPEGTDQEPQGLFLEYYCGGRNLDFRDPGIFGSYGSLLLGNYLPAMSSLIRVQSVKDVGGWTEGNRVEDWELWLKLARKKAFVYVDKVVARYRWHGNNTSKTRREQVLRDSIHLLELERDFAVGQGLHRYFYPTYQFNLQLLTEFDVKLARKKRLKLYLDGQFYRYFSKRIAHKIGV